MTSRCTPRPFRASALLASALLLAGVRLAAAQPAPVPTPPPENLVDGRVLLAAPAALATGLTTGVEAGYTRGGRLAWGVRASWSTASELTRTENVRNDDVRLRLVGVLRHQAGRGSFGLRLGLGGTLVYEERTRSQGSRAGLTGEALRQTVWSLLPGADLEALVVLRVVGAWSVTVSGGPTLHILHGAANFGWLAGLGVAWQR